MVKCRFSAAVALTLVLIPGIVAGATIKHMEYAHPGDRYIVKLWVDLAVPASEAFAVVTDFESLPKLNPDILVAKKLSKDRLRTVVSLCILFFCKKVEQVQVVSTPKPLKLVMRVVPEKSDLRFGKASWHFVPVAPSRSRLIFQATLDPDFWVPPLIGGWLIRHKVESETIQTCQGIERAARAHGR